MRFGVCELIRSYIELSQALLLFAHEVSVSRNGVSPAYLSYRGDSGADVALPCLVFRGNVAWCQKSITDTKIQIKNVTFYLSLYVTLYTILIMPLRLCDPLLMLMYISE